MALKPADIAALVDLFGKSGWDELHIEIDGEELFLSNDSRAGGAAATAGIAAGSVTATIPTVAAPHTPASGLPAAAPAARPAQWLAIKAANLGTFYKAASPAAPPYVSLGATVAADSEVCMIEVMKLFTTIRAGLAGVVREICVTDGQMVEYGQDLMWIEPV